MIKHLFLSVYKSFCCGIFSVSHCEIQKPQCGIHISQCGIQIPQCETENRLCTKTTLSLQESKAVLIISLLSTNTSQLDPIPKTLIFLTLLPLSKPMNNKCSFTAFLIACTCFKLTISVLLNTFISCSIFLPVLVNIGTSIFKFIPPSTLHFPNNPNHLLFVLQIVQFLVMVQLIQLFYLLQLLVFCYVLQCEYQQLVKLYLKL